MKYMVISNQRVYGNSQKLQLNNYLLQGGRPISISLLKVICLAAAVDGGAVDAEEGGDLILVLELVPEHGHDLVIFERLFAESGGLDERWIAHGVCRIKVGFFID